jgi:hypothetical protein
MKKRVFAVVLLCAVLIMSFPLHARADYDFDRAIELYGQGKFEETIDILTVYVESKPEPAAYWLIGYSLYKLERFDEADKYFQDTYLIDPDFSPKQIEAFAPGLAEIDKEMKIKLEEFEREVTIPEEEGPLMPTFEPTPGVEGVEAEPQIEGEQVAELQQEPAEPVVEPQLEEPIVPVVQPKVTEPAPPTVAQPAQPPVQQPIQPKPRRQVRPPTTPPQFPGGAEGMGGVAAIMAMMAGFMMVAMIIGVVFYIYFSLCFFLMARKLDVAVPWLAFIPIAQTYTFVAVGGKPWWWILLLLVPIVNFFVGIYIWMCIAENMGKSKWLGLLVLVPILNLVLPGYLAFSKSEGAAISTGEDEFGGGEFGGGDFGGEDFGTGGSEEDIKF